MKRVLLLTVAVAVFVVATKLIVEDALGLSLEGAAAAWLADPGAGGAALIVGLLAADVFLPVPSSLVMVLSGAAFGVWWGAGLALVGSITGEWLGFELVRRYGRAAAARLLGDQDFSRFETIFARHGAVAVLVTRPLPVVMETMSLVAGLSGMRRGTFLLASLAGTVPIVLLYAYAGAYSRETGNALPAIVIVVTMGLAAWLWSRGREHAAPRGRTPAIER